jgi:hypothetical protein
MTFEQTLVDYFNANQSVATEAMHCDLAISYVPWKQTQPVLTEFGEFAEPLGISIKLVDNYGGEDQGSTYYAVYQFSKDGEEDVYIKFHGWYASYDGATFDDFKVVQPKHVIKVEFE